MYFKYIFLWKYVFFFFMVDEKVVSKFVMLSQKAPWLLYTRSN